MEEIKNTVSDAQKAAQKKYDQKTKTVSIKYTPADMEDYERLKMYLDRTGKSTNKFIKELVNDFFDSGKGEIYENVIEKRLHSTQSYYNYVNISMDKIQPLSDYFGELIVRMMLREYDRILKDSMVNKRADCEMKLGNWLEDVLKSIENGDFEGKAKGERYKILIDSLHTFLNII
ncbi:hypothetical protein [Thomasclavelia cocleata]|uniref:hypothetical protein n=1 Tax=Thomasclavelia cocleata TaxID=69824 RepID=UPI00255AFCF9|nr:hypothetical protein [Thomasclavelia cocleata]